MYHIKEDKKNQTTCQLIVKALEKLIKKKAYDTITISELSDLAGVGRTTFYRAFDSIEDVLKYEVDKEVNNLFTYMFPKLTEERYITEAQVFLLFFEFWKQHIDILAMLIKCNKTYVLEDAFKDLFNTKLTFLQDLIDIHTYKWDYFIAVRTAILISTLNQWVCRGCKESPETITNILISSHNSIVCL